MKVENFTEDFNGEEAIKIVTAIVNNNAEELSMLEMQDVNFDVEGDYGKTPLRIAIEIDNINIFKLLLNYGANPNFRTKKGVVAAKYAAQNKNHEFLSTLLEFGLDPNIKHVTTPIIFYAIENDLWVNYDILVEAGANLSVKQEDNSTVALYLAMQFEYERLKYLIEIGVDVNTVSNSKLSVVGLLAKMQKRFSANPEHTAYKMRIELLEILRHKGLEIPPNVPGMKYK